MQILDVIGESGVATPTHGTSVLDDWYCIAGYIRNIYSCVGDRWFFFYINNQWGGYERPSMAWHIYVIMILTYMQPQTSIICYLILTYMKYQTAVVSGVNGRCYLAVDFENKWTLCLTFVCSKHTGHWCETYSSFCGQLNLNVMVSGVNSTAYRLPKWFQPARNFQCLSLVLVTKN